MIFRCVLPFIALSACGSTITTPTVIPNDGNDDAAALQAQIDEAAASGGGEIRLPPGRIDVSRPIVLRDGVTIVGADAGTLISSVAMNRKAERWGTTIFAGTMTPASYADNGGMGYPRRPAVRVGPSLMRLADCSDAPRPGNVVWISTATGFAGAGGYFRPDYGEISVATEVDGCLVRLADPIGAAAGARLRLDWSDGRRFQPGDYVGPNAPIKNAGLRNVALESYAEALIVDGCYACTFTNIDIVQSRQLLSVEGVRHMSVDGLRGTFTERGLEFAMYATDNSVKNVNVTWERREARKIAPAIRFGERATRNEVKNVTMRLGDSLEGRRDKVRMDDASGNTISGIKLLVTRRDRVSPLFAKTPTQSAQGSHVKVCLESAPDTCYQ